ncbi:MAG: tricarballylate utilization 4Fe-4S protein TcuB [Acetobacteraceae bacterium]|nr:tricarballylate utilization 4Fe-4S protein TcuB [Acetobacteraceae bacterium]
MRETDAIAEARRNLEVCNACRYCEGYCAVFPAMELRREFTAPDLGYLANLCHGCRGCYYACQYAPPHEFGINLPKVFAEIRDESYREYAWPQPMARLFERNGTVVSVAAALMVALVMIGAALLVAPERLFGAHQGAGAFYAVIPHNVMVLLGGATFGFALLAIAVSVVKFRHAIGGEGPVAKPFAKALHDALTLKNLGGGGHGCNDRDGSFGTTRRRFHHALFYGFMLCFASTSIATLYHYVLREQAPYGLLSLPVVLGTVGGIGMTIGCAGLIWLKVVGDSAPVSRRLLGADYAMLVLLLLVAVTGLVLLAVRATPAMGITLAIHLGFVLALFLALPYSRMVHGAYRLVALFRAAREH